MTKIYIEIADWILYLAAAWIIIEVISRIAEFYQRRLQRKINEEEAKRHE